MKTLRLIAGTRAKFSIKVPADALAQYTFRAGIRRSDGPPIKVIAEGSGITRTTTGLFLVFDVRNTNLEPGSDYQVDVQLLDSDQTPVMQRGAALKVVPNILPL